MLIYSTSLVFSLISKSELALFFLTLYPLNVMQSLLHASLGQRLGSNFKKLTRSLLVFSPTNMPTRCSQFEPLEAKMKN